MSAAEAAAVVAAETVKPLPVGSVVFLSRVSEIITSYRFLLIY
jgi:hypothetical protein